MPNAQTAHYHQSSKRDIMLVDFYKPAQKILFDFCPRFLDSGKFQIFLYDKRDMQIFTIFHEMLHFIFYDFAKKTFPEKFKNADTDKGEFWDLSEVFNTVIQDTGDFIKLHGKIKELGYPDHKHLIIKGKKLWKENQDLSKWITGMMNS